MGWSFGSRAGWVLDAWHAACNAANGGGSCNVFEDGGSKYFFEASRKERADGAICGSVHKFVGENRCKKSGSFRIDKDGSVARAPKWLKDRSPSAAELSDMYRSIFGKSPPEERVAENHAAFNRARYSFTLV